MEIYCVKCKQFTPNKGKITIHRTSNNRKYKAVKCAICGKKKTKFI